MFTGGECSAYQFRCSNGRCIRNSNPSILQMMTYIVTWYLCLQVVSVLQTSSVVPMAAVSETLIHAFCRWRIHSRDIYVYRRWVFWRPVPLPQWPLYQKLYSTHFADDVYSHVIFMFTGGERSEDQFRCSNGRCIRNSNPRILQMTYTVTWYLCLQVARFLKTSSVALMAAVSEILIHAFCRWRIQSRDIYVYRWRVFWRPVPLLQWPLY